MKSIGTLAVVALLASTSCDGRSVGFDMTEQIPTVTVQGDPAGNAALASVPDDDAPTLTITGDAPPQHIAGAARADLMSLELDIVAADASADAGCFDFVRSVTVSVESTLAGTHLSKHVVATGNAPGCVRTWRLTPAEMFDVLPYANEGFRITVIARGIPPVHDVSFDGNAVLHIGVL
jgi:hypothetical protein